ncbi:MAG: SPOR domain-containing protein [Desulfatirhabdiaceae bacterium]
MYKDFYHLKSEPFSTHPNPGMIFTSNTHKEAWYYLLFGIDTQEPFLVLTGEYGMGKTLLCLRLIQAIKKKGKFSVEYIPTPSEGYGGILRRIAASMGITAIPEEEAILQDVIYDRFRSDSEKNRFYLIVDDAHELDTNTLTKLKHLSTFNHDGFFPIIMIFVAHPSFLQGLQTPALSSLSQRIKRRYHLARFTFEDTKNYIFFRLLKSGASGIPVLPDETLQKIFDYSGGIPRLINNICDTCLLIGASKGLVTIPPGVVDEAKQIVEGSLVGNAPEAKADLKSDMGDGTFMTIAEDLPPDEPVEPDYMPLTVSDSEYDETEKKLPEKPSFGKTLKNLFFIILLAFFLMVSGAFLYHHFFKDTTLFTSRSPETQPVDTPQQIHKPVHQLPDDLKKEIQNQSDANQSKNEVAAIPTLREELSPAQPALAAPPPGTDQTRISSLSTTDDSAQQNSQMSIRPTIKTENTASETNHTKLNFPYSLRGSSYQQPDRATPEIMEIRQMGLIPYLVKADLGDMGLWWRIYIGFYATEEEAQKIRTAHKLDSTTVQKTEYACLIDEYSNETDTMTMFEKLKETGYFPYVLQKAKDRYGLYIGAFEKKSEAERQKQDLKKNGFICQVVNR